MLPDVNVLVYAVDESAAPDRLALSLLTSSVSRGAPIGIPWITIQGFLRIATSERATTNPVPVQTAARIDRDESEAARKGTNA